MSKPPQSPGNSDIDGVDGDRERVDRPANAKPDPGQQLKDADDQSKGRPDGGGA